MNKLRYRIIFNQARGMCMAVQENARSCGKGEGAASSGAAPAGLAGGPATRRRAMALALLGAFGLGGPAAAQIVADPTAAGRLQATVLNTANGVLQVNVQTPSAAGVSRNVYRQFDVSGAGAVLNNSRVPVQTQLGGWVDGNPWMAHGSARVILNEVNSSAPSQLRGYIEVAGSRAETVIANPAGIVVDGAGFINVSRATLTTGAPVLKDGAIDGYRVQRGEIGIQGGGLDARRTDYTELIARSLSVNAGLWAQQLTVITGANQVDAARVATALPAAAGVDGGAPRYGIDASLLGGMYANKIMLVGTEAGVGVRNAGSLGAGAGELVVTSAGRLENSGSLAASAQLRLQADEGIVNSGKIDGVTDVALASGAALANSGSVNAGKRLTLEAAAGLVNGGTLSASALQVRGASVRNSGLLSSAGMAELTAQGDIDNAGGTMQARSFALSSMAGGFNNQAGKLLQSGGAALAVQAASVLNSHGGQIGALAPASVDGGADTGNGNGAGNGNGNGTGTGTGDDSGNGTGAGNNGGNTDVGGGQPPAPAPVADGSLRVAGRINNDAGQIVAGGAVALDAGGLDNAGGRVNVDRLSLHGADFSNRDGQLNVAHDFSARVDGFDNHAGRLLVGGRLDATLARLDNSRGLLQAGQFAIAAGGALDNSGGVLRQSGAGGGRLGVGGELDNHGGLLETAGGLTLSSGSIVGAAGKLTVLGELRLDSGATSARDGVWQVAGTATLHTGAFDNHGGVLTSGRDLTLDSAALDNRLGKIVVGDAGTVGASGALENGGGVIQAGQALQLNAGGALDNQGGVIEAIAAAATLQLRAASLDNDGGRIVNAGSGAASIDSRGRIRNSGLIGANGRLTVAAATLDNQSAGSVTAAGDLTLAVRAQLDNRGGIAGGHDLDFRQAGAQLNNSGQIIAGHDLDMAVAGINNDGGRMLTAEGGGGRLSLAANALSNRFGSIVADHDALLYAKAGQFDNRDGLLQARGDVGVEASGAVLNRGGLIEAAGGASQLVVRAGSLDNHAGRIINSGSGDSLLDAAVLANGGQISVNGALDVRAATVGNDGQLSALGPMHLSVGGRLDNGGLIASGGALWLDGAAAQVDNHGRVFAGGSISLTAHGLRNGGQIATTAGSGADLAIDSASFDNRGGSVIASGNAGLNVADKVDNAGGTLQAGRDLRLLAGGVLDNSAGLIEAVGGTGALTLGAASIHNAAGRIVNAGGGATAVSASAVVYNSGLIGGNGTLELGAALAINSADGAIVSARAMALTVGQLNNAGNINSGAALHIGAGGGVDNSGGRIVAMGRLGIDSAGRLDNDGGQIATLKGGGGDIVIAGGGLGNGDGVILSDRNAVLTVNGAIDNARGIVQAGQNLALGAGGALDNRHGVVEALAANATLAVRAADIDNRAGRIVDVGAGKASVTADGGIVNGGLIAGAGTLAVDARRLDNRVGATIAAAGALSLGIGERLDNLGAINGASRLDFSQRTAQVNNGGQIFAAGDMRLSALDFNNDGGRIATLQRSAGDIVLDSHSLSNRDGSMQAGRDVVFTVADGLNNTGGTIQAGRDVGMAAGGVLDNGKGLIEAAGAASRMRVQAGGMVNVDGRIVNVGTGGAAVGAAAELLNGGTIAGNGALVVAAGTLRNSAGAGIAAGAELLLDVGRRLDNQGDISSRGRLDFRQATLGVHNSGNIVAGGRASLLAGSFNNDGGHIATVRGSDADLTLTAASLSNRGGGMLADGAAVLTLAGAADNRGGSVQAQRALALAAGGAVDNGGGNLETAGAAGTLLLHAGSIDNSGGRIVNVGGGDAAVTADGALSNGGLIAGNGNLALAARSALNRAGATVASGRALELSVGERLDNAGAINSGATLDFRQTTAQVNNSGQIVSAGTSNIAAGRFNNDGGQLLTLKDSGSAIVLRSAAMSNRGGSVLASGDAGLAIADAFDNSRGTVQAGKDLTVAAGGALNNNGGVLEAASAASGLSVQAGAIDNTAGRIVNVGAGAATVGARTGLLNSGLIAGNGTLALSAATLHNQAGGNVVSGRDLALAVGQRLDNAGAVGSGGRLDFTLATAQVNNRGTISAAGPAALQAGAFNNDGGQIATARNGGAGITLSSASLSNRGGSVMAGGDAAFSVGGAVDNSAGLLQAGGALSLAASGALANDAGVIEALGGGATLVVQAGAIDNGSGRIANVGSGAMRVVSQSGVINQGSIAGNGSLELSGQTLLNGSNGKLAGIGNVELGFGQSLDNRGSVSSGGTLNFNQAGAGFRNNGSMVAAAASFAAASFDNDGGRIATATGSGGAIDVRAQSVSNVGGKLLASGDLGIDSAGTVDNQRGVAQAGGNLRINAAGTLSNDGGVLEALGAASALQVRAAAIVNGGGRIVNVGNADTFIGSDGGIASSGSIAANGKLELRAQTLQHGGGGSIAAAGDMELAITSQLDNAGSIDGGAGIHFDQAAATLNNRGQIVAAGLATIVADTVDNDGGQIATAKDSAGDLVLHSKKLSNRGGKIVADGKATLTLAGVLDNGHGNIQAGKDLTLAATGALDNDGGVIAALGSAAAMSVVAESIDNGSGRIVNLGSGDTRVGGKTWINNNGGIGANGKLTLSALTLSNGAAGSIESGRGMELAIGSALDNQGKINSAGTLRFKQAGASLNNSGKIVAGGNAEIAVKRINNNGGTLATGADSQADLSLSAEHLGNEGGHITTGRDLNLATKVMQGSGELFGGRDLALSMDGDYTQGGTQQFRSNRDLSLTVTGDIVNQAKFEAVGQLKLSGKNVSNNAGAVMQGQGVSIKADGKLNNAGEINGSGVVVLSSSGTIDNSNAIIGGQLGLTAQNLNNSGAAALLGATETLQLNVAGQLNNTAGAAIYSAGGMTVNGVGGAAVGLVNNVSSTIEAAGDLSLNAASLNNIRENISLVKVQTVDETKEMVLPSWYHHGDNHERFETGAANYWPHESYYVNPADIIEDAPFVLPDGNTIGRVVLRTHANDSAFFGVSTGLHSAYGHRERIHATEGTRVLYYSTRTNDQHNPDAGGDPTGAYVYLQYVTHWEGSDIQYSGEYGNCTTNCVRFITQPGYVDPTSVINRDTLRAVASQAGKLEVSRTAHHVVVEDQLAPGAGNAAKIVSGGDMHLTVGQALTNRYGDIMATGAMTVDGGAAISNEGVTLYSTHTFDGKWYTDEHQEVAYTMPTLNMVTGMAGGVIAGGKGVSISGRSFSNVDVATGTAGNIRDAIQMLGSSADIAARDTTATGNPAGYNPISGGQANASGVANNAGGGGQVSGGGAGNFGSLLARAVAAGAQNNAAAHGNAAASGTANDAAASVNPAASGTANTAQAALRARASGKGNDAVAGLRVADNGPQGKALGDVNSRAGASLGQSARAVQGDPLAQQGGDPKLVKVSGSPLSVRNPDANGSYIFETRPQFANHGQWTGSDYLLKALDMDPATTHKRLGDAFYEQRLVREQLVELTGRAPRNGASDDSRYKELLNSGISYAKEFGLRPGIVLSAEQVAHLTSDIVWLENQNVVLPDGSTETVLVPKVYLAHAGAGAVKPGGALVTGDGVGISTSEGAILNRGGLIDGANGRTLLSSAGDLLNQGGAIRGGALDLKAGGDIVNQTLSIKQEYSGVSPGAVNGGGYTSLSNQAGIVATGALTLDAKRDIVDTGGVIGAASATVTAGRDIAFNTVRTGSTYQSQVQGFTEQDNSVTHQLSQLATSGDLAMTAGRDLALSGAQVAAG
ncbi:filamentous hemagglutinin N-terminal domain-containing protein, partial [Rugamonas sp. CCM 8940]